MADRKGAGLTQESKLRGHGVGKYVPLLDAGLPFGLWVGHPSCPCLPFWFVPTPNGARERATPRQIPHNIGTGTASPKRLSQGIPSTLILLSPATQRHDPGRRCDSISQNDDVPELTAQTPRKERSGLLLSCKL